MVDAPSDQNKASAEPQQAAKAKDKSGASQEAGSSSVLAGLQPKEGIALLTVLAGSLKYIHIIFTSEEKWFHLGVVALVAFASIQGYQFYLNQK